MGGLAADFVEALTGFGSELWVGATSLGLGRFVPCRLMAERSGSVALGGGL
jgi:hypothetical protein